MFLHFFIFFRARIVCPAISGCHISGQYFWLMPVLLTIEYGTTTFPPKRKKTKAVRNTPCLSQRFFCNIYEMGLDKPEMRSYALSEPSRAEPSRAEPSRAEPSRAEPVHAA